MRCAVGDVVFKFDLGCIKHLSINDDNVYARTRTPHTIGLYDIRVFNVDQLY